MNRKPAVSGRFYPSQAGELRSMVAGFLEPSEKRSAVRGVIVPHAGYMYSGHVAGAVYAGIELPSRSIVLGPNHTGFGAPLSIMKSGAWETPLGEMQIDEELSGALMAADPYLADDVEAHRFEHALEVQLPFMQHIAGSSIRFVPITVRTSNLKDCRRWAGRSRTLFRACHQARSSSPQRYGHYESDAITASRIAAIDQILAMNQRCMTSCSGESRCADTGLPYRVDCREIAGRVEGGLVRYATSGDVSLDFDRVVGYAGVIVSATHESISSPFQSAFDFAACVRA
jgi:AmmeMemoRadiSam system protein B